MTQRASITSSLKKENNHPLHAAFYEPPTEFTAVPFWFWNDRLDAAEITRQIDDFHAKSVDGFIIHPRIGMPENMPYMSESYLDMVEVAVERAKQLGMVVFLYDEGMYPSGAANGKVVQENANYASKGLRIETHDCHASTTVAVSLTDGETLVSAQAVKHVNAEETNGEHPNGTGPNPTGANNETEAPIDIRHSIILDVHDGIVQFDAPPNEQWSIVLLIETFSGGHIRGIHYGQDDGQPGAPSSADLLNPDAVDAFIRHTHDKYYARFRDHFGHTIQAFFTDEPDMLGRGKKRGIIPWTGNYLTEYVQSGNAETDLPAMWLETTEGTDHIRRQFRQAIKRRLANVYYRRLYEWCEAHGIALTGHPAEADDIGLLDYFHIPGQDVVWRWVAPEDGKNIEGRQSTQAKCSSDAARHRGRRRNLNECFGVCGPTNRWDLTAGDMKWYVDWLFARGVNWLSPHAFFYSIEGKRADERPPDVGPNNIWWPYYDQFANYMKRMSFVNTDSVNQTHVAVIGQHDHLPWKIVKPLYEHQWEFNYLEEQLLNQGQCILKDGQLHIQAQTYSTIIVEDEHVLQQQTVEQLDAFAKAGGTVICLRKHLSNKSNTEVRLKKAVAISTEEEVVNALQQYASRSQWLLPQAADIRISHVRKENVHLYILVNEGEDAYSGTLHIRGNGKVEKWDAWSGTITDAGADHTDEGFTVPVHLNRRESIIYARQPEEKSQSNTVLPPRQPSMKKQHLDLSAGWQVSGLPLDDNADGITLNPLCSWTEWEELKHYSGKAIYRKAWKIEPNVVAASRVELTLGDVYEVAHLFVNGKEVGVRMWAPYTFDVTQELVEGENEFEIHVTNSLTNKMDQTDHPSGLIGPVILTCVE